MSTLGFIGLGIMGKPMAKNLLNAGYDLVVLDINPDAVAELTGMGAAAAKTPAEVAQKADRIITMLPDGPEVEEVVLGANGIIEAAGSGHAVIDMSSISPTVTNRIAAALAERARAAWTPR